MFYTRSLKKLHYIHRFIILHTRFIILHTAHNFTYESHTKSHNHKSHTITKVTQSQKSHTHTLYTFIFTVNQLRMFTYLPRKRKATKEEKEDSGGKRRKRSGKSGGKREERREERSRRRILVLFKKGNQNPFHFPFDFRLYVSNIGECFFT